MQHRSIFIATCLSLSSSLALCQAPPSISPENHQFDFWVGKWECRTIDKSGASSVGTNEIRRILEGRVVQENFKMDNLTGMSVSVYDPNLKKWQQTWVDNQGGYIDLVGEFKDGKMVLITVPKPKAPKIFSRMTFYDITKERFMWDWEASKDGGKTWTLAWRLEYKRKES